MMKKVFTLMRILPLMILMVVSWSNASAQGAYPFPQDVDYSFGLKPDNADNSHVQAAYTNWVNNYVTSDGACVGRRVIFDYFPGTGRGKEDKSRTVSEGIAYGMLIAAYMDDQNLFDDFWKFYKANRNGNGVMHWRIDNTCNVTGANGASDAELDVAMALIVASHQWQSDVYLNDAKSMIRIIREKEFDGDILKPGDQFGGQSLVAPSYFSPAYYRVFKEYDPGYESFWDQAVTKGYEIIALAGGTSGLVPDWTNASGTVSTDPAANGYEDQGRNFIFDAIRTPFRSGIDYLWHGQDDAKQYCEKISGWLTGKYNSAGEIGSKYATKLSNEPEGTELEPYINNTFVGCFGVGLMGTDMTSEQSFLNDIYQTNVSTEPGRGEYFNASFKLMTLMVMTGNFYLPPPDACDSPDLGEDVSLCNAPVTLDSKLSNRTFVWRRNGTVISGSSSTLSVTEPGDYEVIATDSEGCVRRDKVNVASADVEASFIAKPGPGSIILENTSSGGVSNYTWTLDDADEKTDEDVIYDNLGTGSYEVKLTVDNSGFGCSDTDVATKIVSVGDGVGLAVSDFAVANEEKIYAYNLGTTVEPVQKDYCSSQDMEDDAPKVCPVFPCGALEIKTNNAAGTANDYDGYGIGWKDAAFGALDLTDVPYLSIKMYATSPVEVGLKLQMDQQTTNPAPNVEVTTEPQVFNVDYSEYLQVWDNDVEAMVAITAWDAVDAIQILPFSVDQTWEGTVYVEWFVVGAKSISPPSFSLKKDENGYTDFSNYLPEYYPNDPAYDGCTIETEGEACYGSVPDWKRSIALCAGESTTLEANSCDADQIRWYKGDASLGSGETIEISSAGMYYVELINQGGITRDSVEVTGGGAPEANFAYTVEDYGKGYRFQINATNFDTFEWDYGIPVTELEDPDAVTWEEGYNYYDTPGEYDVCLEVSNSECPSTPAAEECKTITVECQQDEYTFTFSSPDIVDDTIKVCGGSPITVEAAARYASSTADEPLTGTDAIVNYLGWYGFDDDNEMSTTESVTFTPTDFSNYLKIDTENKCGVKTADSIYVEVTPGVAAAITINQEKSEEEQTANDAPLYTVFETPWAGEGATYEWSVDGNVVADADGLEAHIDFFNYGGAGSHIVSVEVTGDCGTETDEQTFDVCSPEQTPTFEITGANLSAELNYTGGDFDENYYTYTWVIDGADFEVTENPYTHDFVTEGEHTVNLVINNGCEDFTGTEDTYIAEGECTPIDAADVVFTESTSDVCGNETGVVYTIGLVDDANSYDWTVPTGATFTESTEGNSITVDFGTTSGDVVGTAKNSCSEESATVAVAIKETPDAAFTSSVTGTVVELDVTSPDAGTTYTWNIDGNVESGASVEYDLGASGTYTVSLVANNGCDDNEGESSEEVCIGIASSEITEISGSDVVLDTDLPVTYSVESITGATYTWDVPATWSFTGSGTNEITVSAIDVSGTVSVDVSSTCTTTPISRELDVEYSAEVSDIALTVNPDGENGITGEVSYEGGNADDVITWTITNSDDPTDVTTATGSTIDEDLSDGDYDVCVVVSNSATTSASECKAVNVNNNCTPKLGDIGTIVSDEEVCEGSDVDLSIAEVTNAETYTWSTTSGTITGTGTTVTLTGASGTAQITVIAENDCGVREATKNISVVTAPTADFTFVNSQTQVSFTASNPNPNYTYTWDLGDGNTDIGSQITHTYASFGDYDVTLDVTSTVCTTPASVTKTITTSECDNPTTPITDVTVTSGDNPISGCLASSLQGVTFTALPADDNATTYTWTFPNGEVETKTSNKITIVGYSKGSGDIVVTSEGACDQQEFTIAVDLGIKPSVNSVTFEAEQSSKDFLATVVFTAIGYNSAFTYEWTEDEVAFGSGAEEEVQNYTDPNIYNVCLKASNACGTESYCNDVNVKVTALEDELNDYTTSVYPTITANDFVVELGGNLSGTFDVVVSNMIGNEVQKGEMRGGDAKSFDISDLPAGMYLVTIQRGDTQFTKRVMKR